jgi:hypothetical protein
MSESVGPVGSGEPKFMFVAAIAQPRTTVADT